MQQIQTTYTVQRPSYNTTTSDSCCQATLCSINCSPEQDLVVDGSDLLCSLGVLSRFTMTQPLNSKRLTLDSIRGFSCCPLRSRESQLLRDITGGECSVVGNHHLLFLSLLIFIANITMITIFSILQEESDEYDDDYYYNNYDFPKGLWAIVVIFLLMQGFVLFAAFRTRYIYIAFYVAQSNSTSFLRWFRFRSPALVMRLKTERFDECAAFVENVLERAETIRAN